MAKKRKPSEYSGNYSPIDETAKFSEKYGECFPSDAGKKSSEILRELFRDGGDSEILQNVRGMLP
jgi:hypothetical protein